jgi:polyhydroxyalkanoate synthesis regulator phasin
MLAKMNDRAERLIDQVESEGDLAELGEDVQKIMDGLLKSFAEATVDLDPDSIEEIQKERRSAQVSGISANDIDGFEDFIKSRG